MLQISTGKFFDTAEFYETVHRGVLYTNLSMLRDDGIDTPVGKILPTTRWGDIEAVTCEVIERQPKYGPNLTPGLLISVGPDTFIHDFAAVASFALQATFTPDHDLAMRLLTAQRPPLGIRALPKQYVSKIFDVPHRYEGAASQHLSLFLKDMLSLQRSHYAGVMRAIRRYITAMHRIADDLDLAYSLFVAAIESLAQDFDGFVPEWQDYDQRKRKALDIALEAATDETAISVRQAILNSEHVAIGRRFREFSLAHLGSGFFRDKAKERPAPVGRGDLEVALKQAYELRSGYVHLLRPLPKMLASKPAMSDTLLIDGRPYLTFEGLSRVARSVIEEFVRRAPKTDREKHDFTQDYPNLLRAPLAPNHWIHNVQGYSPQTAHLYLNAFLSEVERTLLNPDALVTDVRGVTAKIESLLRSLAKPEQRRPLLALHYLFGHYLSVDEREASLERVKKFIPELNTPSPESFFLYVFEGRIPDWPAQTCEALLQTYFRHRYDAGHLNVGTILGAAGALTVAELYRAADEASARRLINWAVDQFPGISRLRAYEEALAAGELQPIRWWEILLPERTTPSEAGLGARSRKLVKLNRRLHPGKRTRTNRKGLIGKKSET